MLALPRPNTEQIDACYPIKNSVILKLSQMKLTLPGKQSWGKAMRSRSFGTLMSSVAEDASVRLVVSPLGNTSGARSRLFCKQTEDAG